MLARYLLIASLSIGIGACATRAPSERQSAAFFSHSSASYAAIATTNLHDLGSYDVVDEVEGQEHKTSPAQFVLDRFGDAELLGSSRLQGRFARPDALRRFASAIGATDVVHLVDNGRRPWERIPGSSCTVMDWFGDRIQSPGCHRVPESLAVFLRDCRIVPCNEGSNRVRQVLAPGVALPNPYVAMLRLREPRRVLTPAESVRIAVIEPGVLQSMLGRDHPDDLVLGELTVAAWRPNLEATTDAARAVGANRVYWWAEPSGKHLPRVNLVFVRVCAELGC